MNIKNVYKSEFIDNLPSSIADLIFGNYFNQCIGKLHSSITNVQLSNWRYTYIVFYISILY